MPTHVQKLKATLSENPKLMENFSRFQQIMEDYINASILDVAGLEDLEEIGRKAKILSAIRTDFQEIGAPRTISKPSPRPKLRS